MAYSARLLTGRIDSDKPPEQAPGARRLNKQQGDNRSSEKRFDTVGPQSDLFSQSNSLFIQACFQINASLTFNNYHLECEKVRVDTSAPSAGPQAAA